MCLIFHKPTFNHIKNLWDSSGGLIIIYTSKHTNKPFCDKQCGTEDSLTHGMNAMVNLVAKQIQEIHLSTKLQTCPWTKTWAIDLVRQGILL